MKLLILSLALVAVAHSPSAQVQKQAKSAKAELANPDVIGNPIVPLRMVVSGLTKENSEQVKAALAGLMTSAHVCEPCKFVRARAGDCPSCKAPLQAAMKPLLSQVIPSVDDGSITISINQRLSTRVSELEATLAKMSVKIDQAKLPLPGPAQLVVRGGTSDQVAAVQKTLQDANLFSEVHATWEPAGGLIQIRVRSNPNPPTRDTVAAKLKSMQLDLSDVVLGQIGDPI